MLTSRGPEQGVVSTFRLIRNISANWIGLLTVLLVGIFLTPFILHHLGPVAFGLWVLITTVTGYYGLLDFGIRNAVLRYAARFRLGEQSEVAEIISTAFFTYAMIGGLILLLAIFGAWRLESLLRVPAAWVQPGKMLLMVVGIGTALSFPLSVFGAVLEGLQLFTWIAAVQSAGALIRAGLIVAALQRGYGLLAVGVITVAINLITSLAFLCVATVACPHMRLHWRYVRRRTLHMLGTFGVITFWIGIAQKLRFEADTLVIGAFLSVEAIAVFAIASKLVSYATDLVQNVAQVFTPVFSYLDATGDRREMRRALVLGNRYSSFIAFSMAAVLLVMGRTIIHAWVGAEYASSYAILVTLTIPTALYLAQAASTKVLYGMARHHALAWVLLAEGLANVTLSILLLRRYGILGVALGTAIPLLVTSVVFLPVHVCRLVDLRLSEYLRDAHLYPVMLSATLGACLWLVGRWVHSGSYVGVVLQLSLGTALCGLGLIAFRYVMASAGRLQPVDDAEIVQRTA
ncbi:MAG TPA: oligosaccharide flippase family protein [Gemmatimonadaceae bacterium]